MSKKNKKKNENRNAPKQDKIATKKAAVLGNEKKNRTLLWVAVIGIVLIAGGGVFYFSRTSNTPVAVASAPTTSTATMVSFPASLFEDGKARYFEHISGKLNIKYFILKSSDGVIRAAFDACDVCWPAGKGYFQEGDYMVCRNCGRRFKSVLVNEVKGGCNPAPLNRNMQDGKVVIQVKDILEGQQYFNFAGKV
jgi:uncharacterized membrane protein